MLSDLEHRVNEKRAFIAATRAEIDRLSRVAIPLAESLQRLDAWLDDGIAELTRWNAGPAAFMDPAASAGTISSLADQRTPGAGAGLLLRVFRPQVRAALAAEIEKAYGAVEAGPDAGKRAKALTQLREKVWAAELEEERLIVDGERAGQFIARRVDVDPRVLVEVL